MAEFVVKLRPATILDNDFAFHVWKTSMQQYVEMTWGWDEDSQIQHQQAEFVASHYQIIEVAGQSVGTLIVNRYPDHMYLSGLYLLPQYQRQGIGSTIMRELFAEAQSHNVPIRLRVLNVNSQARRLYERLGFIATDESKLPFTVMEYIQQVDAEPRNRV